MLRDLQVPRAVLQFMNYPTRFDSSATQKLLDKARIRVPPLEDVRDEVAQTLAFERRQTMVDDWIAGLRRRAAVTDVYTAPGGVGIGTTR